MTTTIRLATPGDFEAVSALLAELGRPPLTADKLDAFRAVYLEALGRDSACLLVAEVNKQVVGFMSMEYRPRLNWTSVEAWIPDLIVSEASRGHKIGKALLMEGFERARARGCHRVSLESSFKRQVAHALYRSTMTEAGYYYTLTL